MILSGANRSCDGCNLCCEILEVEEIAKDSWQKCTHMCSSGCDIYERKPQACSDWECAWLKGAVRYDQKPEKSGVVAWTSREIGGLTLYLASKSHVNPLDNLYFAELVEEWKKSGEIVAIAKEDGTWEHFFNDIIKFLRRNEYLLNELKRNIEKGIKFEKHR